MVQAIDDSLLRRGDSRAATLLVTGGSGTAFWGAFADASRPLLLLGGLVRVASRGFFWAGEKLFTGKLRSKFARKRLGTTASQGGR